MVAVGEQVFKASGIIQGSCGGRPELPALCSLAGGWGGAGPRTRTRRRWESCRQDDDVGRSL